MEKVRRPGAEKRLERKLKELQRELRDLEGRERRGFVNEEDEHLTQRRLRAIRHEIAEIQETIEA